MAYQPPSEPPSGGYGGPASPGGNYPGGPFQGGYPWQQPAGPPPANYLVWAILTTMFCCTPLGVASIVFSAQVNSRWAMGDVLGAQDSARKAKNFAITSAVLGLIGIAIYAYLIHQGVLE